MFNTPAVAGTRLRGRAILALFAFATLATTPKVTLAAVEDDWSAATIQAMKAERERQSGATKPRRAVRVASLGNVAYPGADEPAPQQRQAKRATPRKAARVRMASLGRAMPEVGPARPSLSGGGIRWVANSGCLAGTLKSVVASIASTFGPVTVSSTCRSSAQNRRAGGARRSMHLTGNAVDFRVHANRGAVMAYLRSHGSVGGLKHYGGGLFHVDTGVRRSW